MKIYENSVETEVGKLIYSNDQFALVKKIISNNKNVILITPLTKVKDLINFMKDGSLEKLINDFWKDEIVNYEIIEQISNEVNLKIGDNLVEAISDKGRLLKNIFELSDILITNENIEQILNIVLSKMEKLPDILLMGFSNKINTKIPHIQIISSLKGFITYSTIEQLILDYGHSIFEVHDKDSFLSWLELQTKSVITDKTLNNYLNGDESISSYVIDQALKKLNF